MKYEDYKPKYHRLDSCNKCGGLNNETISGNFHDGEAVTKCKDCGHKDHWNYGFYESGEEAISKCKRYVNVGGRLVNLD